MSGNIHSYRDLRKKTKLGNFCVDQKAAFVPLGMLDQLHRNAIVMWATPKKNGLQPHGGLGLTNKTDPKQTLQVFPRERGVLYTAD